MRTHSILLMGIVLTLFSTQCCTGEEKKDADKIQGTWAAVTYVQDGQGEGEKIDPKESPIRWVFKGNKVTFLADVEEASAKGTFKLDPAKKVKTIDINFPPAAGAKKGQAMLGIYEIENDTLKICYEPDGVVRPTEFKSKAGSKLILIGFKQVNK